MFKKVAAALLLCLSLNARAQSDRRWTVAQPSGYSFVHPAQNYITGAQYLAPLFKKLRTVQEQGKGVVRIVHIGDSHIQADMMTSVIRHGFQNFFGNAGRGMVFPYQVAKSNAPLDIQSSSNVTWQANRLAHQEIPIICGVGGFGIHTTQRDAWVRIGLGNDTVPDDAFDMVKLFTGNDSLCYTITSSQYAEALPVWQYVHPSLKTGATMYCLPRPVTSIKIARCDGFPDGKEFSLYGASLEKADGVGVLYHTIGVNGATYEEYNETPLFWQGLPGLEADCYVISMGTNEAQAAHIDADSFITQCRLMVQKLRATAPKATIIITTPAGSYTHAGRPNACLGEVRNALIRFCAEEKIACWDMYTLTGGYPAAKSWNASGLLSHDQIHYNAQGYNLQGRLFVKAMSDAYNAQ